MDPTSEKAKMLAGDLYRAADPGLVAERQRAVALLARFNTVAGQQPRQASALLCELLGAGGDTAVVQPVFACDYGYNIRLGRNAFINYNCVFLDCAPIDIGDDAQIGPAVQIYTATHPMNAELRRSGLESARPVTIGSDVWIGGGAIILPGIRVGDGAVIGAGSVVTRDVLPGAVVAGNPARPHR